jgi:hypothetical protein
VLEPRDFDEVIYPVPEGMRIERLLEVLRALGERLTVVGSSPLEFVPGPTPRLGDLARIVDELEDVRRPQLMRKSGNSSTKTGSS